MKMVDKNWIDVEKIYKRIAPHAVIFEHKETNKIFFVKLIGVTGNKTRTRWTANRWSKKEKKNVHNGVYKDEETAAHASDSLARKLIENGEQGHKINFPDDDTEVYPEKTPTSFKGLLARATLWDDTDALALASDVLTRKLIANSYKRNLKLMYPESDTDSEVHAANKGKKRKRPKD